MKTPTSTKELYEVTVFEPRKEMREKIIWHCGHPQHRHLSQEVAEKCIAKNIIPRISRKAARQRWMSVTRMIVRGSTYEIAGKSINVSRERARQILIMVFRECEDPILKNPITKHYSDIRGIRAEADYFLECLNSLAEKWGVE